MDLEEEKLSLKYTHMIALRLFFKIRIIPN